MTCISNNFTRTIQSLLSQRSYHFIIFFKFSLFHRSGTAGISRTTTNTLFNYHTHTFTSFGRAGLTSPPPPPQQHQPIDLA